MAADLDTLLTADIPEGRQNLLDSHENLEKVAEYCENNYYQCENKRAALEETKNYTTQSLASVAYQINTLAYNFLHALDLHASQIGEMESQVNHITQTVGIHKEKVARREIGVLTTNKGVNRQYKIIAPTNPERPMKYVRKPIDYSMLDDIGHGIQTGPRKQLQSHQPPSQPLRVSTSSPYGPGLLATQVQANSPYGAIGGSAAGPAPTSKPPTPPQSSRYSTSTLSKSKDYRTPSVISPPQVPSNYAPNYPMQPQQNPIYQKSNMKQQNIMQPPQIQMVHPVQQPIDFASGALMPRLSSASMRSNGSHSSNEQPLVSTLGRPNMMGQPAHPQMYRQSSITPPGSLGSRQGTPPSQYGAMPRPSQRPPSPPLPPPPLQHLSNPPHQSNPPQQSNPPHQPIFQYPMQQQNQNYSQQQQSLYGTRQAPPEQQQQKRVAFARQSSEPMDTVDKPYMSNISTEALYARQMSTPASSTYNRPTEQSEMTSNASQIPQGTGLYGTRKNSAILPNNASLPGWVPKNYLERVTAIYDYGADKEDELSFNEGSTIYVLKKNDDGWWEGVMNGITGLFPGNYVEATL